MDPVSTDPGGNFKPESLLMKATPASIASVFVKFAGPQNYWTVTAYQLTSS